LSRLFPSGETELLVLTVVVIAFVFAIWLLRRPGDRVSEQVGVQLAASTTQTRACGRALPVLRVAMNLVRDARNHFSYLVAHQLIQDSLVSCGVIRLE
jgi:hypothetical protein